MKKLEKPKVTKKDFALALKAAAPIMVTFLVLGMGYGILMHEYGFGPLWALLSGVLIFSGTVQFVSVTMLASGGFIMAGLTALMVSARHSFFSVSMVGRYKGEGKKKWYLFYALCDETYAVLSKDEEYKGTSIGAYRVLVTLFDQCAWVAGGVAGGFIGSVLPFDAEGIEFAMTALFITIFLEQWLEAGSHFPALLGLIATFACRLIFGSDIFLIPAMIIIIGVLVAGRMKIEKAMDGAKGSAPGTPEPQGRESVRGGNEDD